MVTTRGGAKAASSKGFTLSEQLRLLWFAIDALTHLTIELGYVWLALTTTAAKSDSYMGYIWREYARADARWAVRDPTVISIEIATVALGFLCLLQLVAVYKRYDHMKTQRHEDTKRRSGACTQLLRMPPLHPLTPSSLTPPLMIAGAWLTLCRSSLAWRNCTGAG